MKKKGLLTLLVSICLILVLAACAQPTPAPTTPTTPTTPTAPTTPTPAPKPVVLKFHLLFPDVSMEYKGIYAPWAKAVEEATSGMVKTEFYFASALGPPPGAWERITTGVTDIEMMIPGYTAGVFPLTSVTELPFLGYPFSSEVCCRIQTELDQKFPEMQAEHAAAKMLFVATTSPCGFHSAKKPINTLEDFKGLVIRAAGAEQSRLIELLGATPVMMPVTDVYLALERGTVDVLNMSMGIFRPYKLHEVTSAHTIVAATTVVFWVPLNKDKWNSLPADIQKTIDKVSAPYWQVAGKAFDGEVAWNIDFIKGAGRTLIYPSAVEVQRWRDTCKVQWDEWVADMKAKGLPGQAVLDEALRLAAEYK